MIKGLLFDLDGTLLDHRAAANAAISAWLEARAPGHPRLAEAPASWEALEEPHLAAWHAGECTWQAQRRRRVTAFCREFGLDVPADVDTAFASYAVHYRRNWVPYPDAAAGVASVRGLRLGVLTNGGQSMQEDKVRAIGLEGRVGPVLTGELLGGHYKPSPEAYAGAAEALGLAPEEVVLVGDDIAKDVIGPAAVGMGSVWLDRHSVLAGPDGFARITSLTELPGVL
ncbi:HAD family hydrolase [Nonomuraea sp. NPDC050536]|uniref:HAD family hydrolase n=1 Tax=Nonomuraea sp. NPDC050536 TaxID=3364366 RepID=UPI0037C70B78